MNRRTERPCQHDPGLFFPEGEAGHAVRAQMRDAKAICWSLCSMRQECLEYAMRMEGDESIKRRAGVYGGLTPAERVELGKKRRAAATGQELAA